MIRKYDEMYSPFRQLKAEFLNGNFDGILVRFVIVLPLFSVDQHKKSFFLLAIDLENELQKCKQRENECQRAYTNEQARLFVQHSPEMEVSSLNQQSQLMADSKRFERKGWLILLRVCTRRRHERIDLD